MLKIIRGTTRLPSISMDLSINWGRGTWSMFRVIPANIPQTGGKEATVLRDSLSEGLLPCP
jgi:hypothetical protein